MSELNEELRHVIDEFADAFSEGMSAVSSEKYLEEEYIRYHKCKKICTFINILVLSVCIGILYFHLKG